MQQLEKTIKTLGAAGVVMVVDSDTSGGKFEPIPLSISCIVFPNSVDSQVSRPPPWPALIEFLTCIDRFRNTNHVQI